VGLEDDPLNAARFHPGENAESSKESPDIHNLKNTERNLLVARGSGNGSARSTMTGRSMNQFCKSVVRFALRN
jgi:hypothetical protein